MPFALISKTEEGSEQKLYEKRDDLTFPVASAYLVEMEYHYKQITNYIKLIYP